MGCTSLSYYGLENPPTHLRSHLKAAAALSKVFGLPRVNGDHRQNSSHGMLAYDSIESIEEPHKETL